MFKKNLYITRGINESIREDIILLLWSLIHEHEGKRELDYLQVFELKTIKVNSGNVLSIHWTQEQPEWETTLYYPDIDIDIDTKVWVICSGENTDQEYSTMLLPEEY